MAKSLKGKNHLVWIDCEMTGLDPERDRLIEIATIITNNQLRVVAKGPSLVIRQPASVMAGMDSWNRKHHGASGLTDKVLRSTISVDEAAAQTLRFIKKYCYKGKSPLCGNSVGQDRRFLAKYMPAVDDYLHYNIVDVSSIKQVVGRWYTKDRHAPPKKKTHTALSDIIESIEELRYYKDHIFAAEGRRVRLKRS